MAKELFETIDFAQILADVQVSDEPEEPEVPAVEEPPPKPPTPPTVAQQPDNETIDIVLDPDNKKTFRHLAFDGGGTRGIAYAGALTELKDHAMVYGLKTAVGTSIGAFVAMLFAVGNNIDEVINIMKDFTPHRFVKARPRMLCSIANYFCCLFACSCCGRGRRGAGGTRRDYTGTDGILDSDGIYRSLGEYIAAKGMDPDITFAQLFARTGINFVATGTNIATSQIDYFSHENTPNLPVRTAVLCSMSYPFIFDSVIVGDECYIDGGLANNYPMDYMRQILPETEHQYMLGFKLDSEPEKGDLDLKDPIMYARHLISIMCATIEDLRQELGDRHYANTVSINTGVSESFDPVITGDEREYLLECGRQGTATYFAF